MSRHAHGGGETRRGRCDMSSINLPEGDTVTTTERDRMSGPVAATERIVPMDVLRGFALLGILVMNIQSFAMVGAAYDNPTALGDLNGANFLVWLLSHLLADQKFLSIFYTRICSGMATFFIPTECAGFSSISSAAVVRGRSSYPLSLSPRLDR